MRISPKQLLHGLFYSTPVLLLALAACGGGGGGGGSSGVAAAITATATPTAQILTVGSPMTPFSPLTASGGTPPYTYSNSGTLPGGVTMVPSTGVVSGAPSIAASGVTATMTFSVRDANNVVASTTSTVNFAVFGAWGGTKQLGASGATTRGFSTATDASGNVYVAGSTTGNLVSGIGLSTGNSDFFLSTFSAASAPAVTKQMGVSGTVTIGNSVATDASGNVYVAGSTTGNLVNNTSLSTNTTDMFLARYDSSGNLAASKSIIQLGVIGADTIGYAVATDASGNVYVAGSTIGNLDGNHSAVTTDMFLAKYDSSGNPATIKPIIQLGVIGADTIGYAVATDASG
ncbi:MAG TPA: SBBP repeat-containing protein, partial [Gallionella sp.]